MHNRLPANWTPPRLPIEQNEDLEAERLRLRHLIGEEVAVNRRELERLYGRSHQLLGELRYSLLGRLSDLERVCAALERHSKEEIALERLELERLRNTVSELMLNAVQLRQDCRLLIGTYDRAVARAAGRAEHIVT